jgi:GNAT superfamily N-acetyltransferase
MLRFVKFMNTNTNVLRNVIKKDGKNIGNIDLNIQKGDPIITEMTIEEQYRKQGYGSQLLNNTEEELIKLGANNIQLNLWSLDRCFFNYLSFYNKRGYQDNLNDNKYEIFDDGENVYYNLNLNKKLGD